AARHLRDAAAIVLGALRGVKDDDVPDLGVGEARADAVDEHPLADVQRRLHRLAGDPVGLHEEGLDPEREGQGGGDDEDELQQRAGGRFLLLGGTHSCSRAPSGAAPSAASAAAGSEGSPSEDGWASASASAAASASASA